MFNFHDLGKLYFYIFKLSISPKVTNNRCLKGFLEGSGLWTLPLHFYGNNFAFIWFKISLKKYGHCAKA